MKAKGYQHLNVSTIMITTFKYINSLIYPFLAAQAALPRSIWEKVELLLFFKIDRGKIASAARNWINSVPQTDATTFAIASVSILLLWNRWTADLRIWFQRREAAGPEAGPPSRTCTRPTSAYSRPEHTHSTLLWYFSKPFRFLLKSNLIILSTPFYFSFHNNCFHIFLFFAFEIIYSFIFFVCS